MRQVLVRSLALCRRPAVWVTGLLLALGGSALVFVPLFGLPGYELSLTLSILTGLLGGIVGASSGFLERTAPSPKPLRGVGLAWMAACTVLVIALAIPFLASTAFALLSTACSPFASVAFYPALVLPSALLSSAAGVVAALASRRRRGAAGWYIGAVLLSLVFTVWPLFTGPQVFAYNHFLGYLSGPLYDEAVSFPASLLWFRFQTVTLAFALWLFGAWLYDSTTGGLRGLNARPGIAAGFGALLVLAVFNSQHAGEHGYETPRALLEDGLGGHRETPHFHLFFSRAKDRADVDRWARDLEFRHAQLAAFFGESESTGHPAREKLRVYVYGSPAEKLRWTGAFRTQFAKPWLGELHVNDAAFPHPILKHELAHLMASPFGAGPFDVSVKLGVWPLAGLIEGTAVAADDPDDELTLHEWAAAMRKQKLAPDIRELVRPRGFYSSAPARAYTLVGSFLRYLADTHGREKLRQLYAHGDFEDVYARPLDSLAREWETFVDSVPLDDAAVNLAFERFRRGALFSRPCAREVAKLSEKAAQTLGSDPAEAKKLYARCSELQPEEPGYVLGQVRALQRLEGFDEAAKLLRELQQKVSDKPALLAEALMAEADLYRQRGQDGPAGAALTRILELRAGATQDRTARVKLSALGSDAASTAIWGYFGEAPDELKLMMLRDAVKPDASQPVLSYLLGRRLRQAGASKLSLQYLDKALAGELPDTVRKEALRLKLESLFLSGDCAGVGLEVGRLPGYGAAFRAAAEDWAERCAFEDRAFNGPLVPKESFR
ncbi:MAG: hypothetical protein ACT4TC_18190 [Myxococcaceae bacterium]